LTTDRKLHMPRPRMIVAQRSFAVNSLTIWNSLPAALHILDSSLAVYKHNLRQTWALLITDTACDLLTSSTVTINDCRTKQKWLYLFTHNTAWNVTSHTYGETVWAEMTKQLLAAQNDKKIVHRDTKQQQQQQQ